MFDLKDKKIHLVGICGTAMASLAGLLNAIGAKVSGSDKRFYPPMGDFLKNMNIKLYESYSKTNVKNDIDLFVIGNSISRGNEELEEILSNNYNYVSMVDILNHYFLTKTENIVITGTHGKTTTSSLTAFLLEKANIGTNFFIGGIIPYFNSSFNYKPNNKYFVLEGDEYDSAYFDKTPKFLHYRPKYLIINNIEFDHGDIYNNLEEIKLQFKRLVNLVPSNGLIVVNGDDENVAECISNSYSKILKVGFNQDNDYVIIPKFLENKKQYFDLLVKKDNKIYNFFSNLLGKHNLYNQAITSVLLNNLGIEFENINKLLQDFTLPLRRLEKKFEKNTITLYDDFAHHPTAINTTLEALRSIHKNNRIIAIFEPRSWTSRKNFFQNKLPTVFNHADIVYMKEVFDKDKVINPLNVPQVIENIKNNGKEAFFFLETEDIVEHYNKIKKENDVIIIMSNGDFDNIISKLYKKI